MILYPNPDPDVAIPIFAKFPEIQAVYLFGSHVGGRLHEESDVDLGYLAERNLYDELSMELIMVGFSRFDLVYMPDVSLLLQFEIVRKNCLLYERPDFDSSSFFSKTVRMYYDFQYTLKIQREIYKWRKLHGQL